MRTFILLLLPAALTCRAQADTAVVRSQATAVVKELSPSELSAMIKTTVVYICDCNEAEMYQEAHVPGAKLVVYDAITPDILPADRDAALVFYCYSPECPAGSTAAHTATELGYSRVYCMKAGITGWQDAQLDTDP